MEHSNVVESRCMSAGDSSPRLSMRSRLQRLIPYWGLSLLRRLRMIAQTPVLSQSKGLRQGGNVNTNPNWLCSRWRLAAEESAPHGRSPREGVVPKRGVRRREHLCKRSNQKNNRLLIKRLFQGWQFLSLPRVRRKINLLREGPGHPG